jgi:hypothetical protein
MAGVVTLGRWGMAVTYSSYKLVTVSLPRRLSNDRFTRQFQKLNDHLDPEAV